MQADVPAQIEPVAVRVFAGDDPDFAVVESGQQFLAQPFSDFTAPIGVLDGDISVEKGDPGAVGFEDLAFVGNGHR